MSLMSWMIDSMPLAVEGRLSAVDVGELDDPQGLAFGAHGLSTLFPG